MKLSTRVSILLGLTLSPVFGIVLKVPAEPTVKLATALDSSKESSCEKLFACLSEHGADHDSRKAFAHTAALKTFWKASASKGCSILESLGKEKGDKLWAIFSKDSQKKPSLSLLMTSRSRLAEFCLTVDPPKATENPSKKSPFHVPLPEKTTVQLPQPPNGHPQTLGAPQTLAVPVPPPCSGCKGHQNDASKSERPSPTCQKLGDCLTLDQGKIVGGFEKCVTDFCKDIYGDKILKESDAPQTALCDEKGTKAVSGIIAKARKAAKQVTLKGEVKTSFIALKTGVDYLVAQFCTESPPKKSPFQKAWDIEG